MVLVLNLLHFFDLVEIKKVLPKILNAVKKDGILIIQMYDSKKTDWINGQFNNFKILKHVKWEYEESFPKLHVHKMVRWVLRN